MGSCNEFQSCSPPFLENHRVASRNNALQSKAVAQSLPEVVLSGAGGMEDLIRSAALALFVERGFHGTSMRDIALRSGTTVSHLYYYFPSKAEVLKTMMLKIANMLLKELTALESANVEPALKLRTLVQAQVLFHSQRQAEAFLGRSEMRSLQEEDRRAVELLYESVTATFKRTILEGVRTGHFDCPHVTEATSAIVTMCNGVSGWYQPGRGLTPDTLASRYEELSLRMVGSKK